MLRFFNSLQFVGMLAAMPYIITWLSTKPIPYASAAMYTSGGIYVIMIGITIGAIYDLAGKEW